ncbi:MAG TPA: hypothetical protein PLA08_03310 [Candidatus Cloacimonadota bacterium]|nr:hypothetical protein [Candidatus Cloacimonadota bacterium]
MIKWALATLVSLWERYKDNDRVDFVMWDNNIDGRKPIKIFEKTDGVLTVYDDKLFALIETPIKLLEGGIYAERQEGTIDEGYFAKHRAEIDRRVAALKTSQDVRRGVVSGEGKRRAGAQGDNLQGLEERSGSEGYEVSQEEVRGIEEGTESQGKADHRYKLTPTTA